MTNQTITQYKSNNHTINMYDNALHFTSNLTPTALSELVNYIKTYTTNLTDNKLTNILLSYAAHTNTSISIGDVENANSNILHLDKLINLSKDNETLYTQTYLLDMIINDCNNDVINILSPDRVNLLQSIVSNQLTPDKIKYAVIELLAYQTDTIYTVDTLELSKSLNYITKALNVSTDYSKKIDYVTDAYKLQIDSVLNHLINEYLEINY